jgi:hypothetical protein
MKKRNDRYYSSSFSPREYCLYPSPETSSFIPLPFPRKSAFVPLPLPRKSAFVPLPLPRKSAFISFYLPLGMFFFLPFSPRIDSLPLP